MIGDVHSTERGSGARKNDGKMRTDLVTMRLLQQTTWLANDDPLAIVAAYVADFEEGCPQAALALSLAFRNIPTLEGQSSHALACAVFAFGAQKYAAWNWAKGMAWSVPLACIKRHWLALVGGEALDAESGLSHWGHIGCNIMMLLHFLEHYKEGDDRPPQYIFSHAGDQRVS